MKSSMYFCIYGIFPRFTLYITTTHQILLRFVSDLYKLLYFFFPFLFFIIYLKLLSMIISYIRFDTYIVYISLFTKMLN